MLRPFLNVPRTQLEHYAHVHQLEWVEDPTNQKLCFDRNYLRQTVIPLLKQRWPQVAQTVSRSARHCANAYVAAQSSTELAFAKLFNSQDGALDIAQLMTFSDYQQRLLVRRWLQAHGLRMPSESVLEHLFEQVIGAEVSRTPELRYQHVIIRRFRQHLYCFGASVANFQTYSPIIWPAGATYLELNAQQSLLIEFAEQGIDYQLWQNSVISVGVRQGGEKLRLAGRAGLHSLKKLFQEAAIPTWERDCMPLIYLDGQLAAVADRWISAEVATKASTKAVQILWHRQKLPKSTF